MTAVDRWSLFSVVDYRYYDRRLEPFLSENAFTQYKQRVEEALVIVLQKRGRCSAEVAREIKAACVQVSTDEVYAEEERIGHDIRALVNCIQRLVSDVAKPYVHMMATSFDIVSTANASRYREATQKVIMPAVLELEATLIRLALQEASTPQIGRTHGQHAVPITFGFALAQYVDRLGENITRIEALACELYGKFSGAVGAYNASSLFFDNPEAFEHEVLAELGLEPARISTQICPPEPLIRLLQEMCLAGGVMANLARDMRNLQRTEIAEVGESFGEEQVGSSTMPQKRNPINFEFVESVGKILPGRLLTVLLDQTSEHQRDLTNSASGRTYGEIFCYLLAMTTRLNRTMKKLVVNRTNLERNLALTQGRVLAEPLYIILASLGHPSAHEAVSTLTLETEVSNTTFGELIQNNETLRPYLAQMSEQQRQILADPTLYLGRSAEVAMSVATRWQETLFPRV